MVKWLCLSHFTLFDRSFCLLMRHRAYYNIAIINEATNDTGISYVTGIVEDTILFCSNISQNNHHDLGTLAGMFCLQFQNKINNTDNYYNHCIK